MDGFSVFDWKKGEVIRVGVIILAIFSISYFQLIIGEMKTRDVQRKADVELVARAVDRYFADYQIYPAATEGGRLVACGDKGAAACNWGSNDSIVDKDNVEYLKGMPNDPFAYKGWRYMYTVDAKRDKYKIYVALEYQQDPERRKDLTTMCGTGLQCNWYVESK